MDRALDLRQVLISEVTATRWHEDTSSRFSFLTDFPSSRFRYSRFVDDILFYKIARDIKFSFYLC